MTFREYVLNTCNNVRVINLVLHYGITEKTAYNDLIKIRSVGRMSLPVILQLQKDFIKEAM